MKKLLLLGSFLVTCHCALAQVITNVTASYDTNNVYFEITGENLGDGYSLFINADNDPATGFQDSDYTSSGAEYLIQNGSLFYTTVNTNDWSWTELTATISSTHSATGASISINISSMDLLGPTYTFGYSELLLWETLVTYPVGDFQSEASGVLPSTDPDITSISSSYDADNLYFTAEGVYLSNNYRLYIDSDNNVDTGYQDPEISASGADYMIEDDILYVDGSSASTEDWSIVTATISSTLTELIASVQINKSAITGLNTVFKYQYADYAEGVKTNQFPDSNYKIGRSVDRFSNGEIHIENPYLGLANYYKGQMHTHTTGERPDQNTPPYIGDEANPSTQSNPGSPDAVNSAVDMVNAYKAEGFDFVAITDHWIFTPDPMVDGILHINGEEVSATIGGNKSCHANAFGITSSIASDTDIQDIINMPNVLVSLNHPARSTISVDHVNSLNGLWAIEIANALNKEPLDLELWDSQISQGKRIWASGTDDSHDVGVVRNSNSVNSDALTKENLFANLAVGNFYVVEGPDGPDMIITVVDQTITCVTTSVGATIKWYQEDVSLITSETALSSSYEITGNEFFVRAEVHASNGKITYSQPLFIIADLDTPSNLVAISESGTSVELTWEDFAINEQGYKIERSTGGGSFEVVGTIDGTLFTDNTVEGGTTYMYRVYAYHEGVSDSAPSNEAEVTTLEGESAVFVIVDGADDAEENGGSVSLTSSDLELGEDGSPQTVGLRFTNITLAQGTQINSAYLRFTVDEVKEGASSLTITAEDIDSSPQFVEIDNNLTDRTTIGTNVAWSPEPWSNIGEKKESADIKNILQAMVSRSGWVSGNAISFLIEGSGTRTAVSGAGQTELVIVYEEGTGTPIAPSELTVESASSTSVSLNWTDNSSNEDSFSIERSTVSGFSEIATVNTDVTSYIDEGLDSATEYTYRIIAVSIVDGSSEASNEASVTPGNAVEESVFPILDGSDDAEELDDGNVSLTSSDIELGEEYGFQTVGLRFTNVTLSNGTPIVSAFLRFTVDEVKEDPASLSITVEDTDSSDQFLSELNNITNRSTIGSSVAWVPEPWSIIGEQKLSEDVVSLVQAIVDRPGWASGNAISFIITGSGTRTAVSGVGAGAIELVVQYEDEALGINEVDFNNKLISYPNPVDDVLNIQNLKLNSRIKIIDLTGRLIHQEIYNGSSINTSFLNSGFYILKMEKEGVENQLKFIKK